MTLTVEQIESLKRGEPVRLMPPELGENVVVVREAVFHELQGSSDEEAEKASWAKLGEEAAAAWAKDNPY